MTRRVFRAHHHSLPSSSSLSTCERRYLSFPVKLSNKKNRTENGEGKTFCRFWFFIMFIICIRNFQLVKDLAKPIFFVFKTREFAFKNVRPFRAGKLTELWRRMIWKNTEWWSLSKIPQSSPESSFTLLYLRYSHASLNDRKHRAATRIGSHQRHFLKVHDCQLTLSKDQNLVIYT